MFLVISLISLGACSKQAPRPSPEEQILNVRIVDIDGRLYYKYQDKNPDFDPQDFDSVDEEV